MVFAPTWFEVDGISQFQQDKRHPHAADEGSHVW